MMWMFLGHLFGWWINPKDSWIIEPLFAIFDPIGAAAFLFISGVSVTLSYRDRLRKAEILKNPNKSTIKNEYLFRALILLIIALIYNNFIAIGTMDSLQIWKWFFLLTISCSLFIAWPLLKVRKIFRISLGAIIWIANYFILEFLKNYQGQPNIYGVIFFILYNSLDMDPILFFFTFFLIGTVIGDIIFEIYLKDNPNERKSAAINNLLIPSLIIGTILTIFGVFFEFPNFLRNRTYPWLVYSLGINLILISVLFNLEERDIFNVKKSYKFLFYFSYYSFTVYLSHNILYFLFLDQLNATNIWFFITTTTILFGLLLRLIYKKLGPIASLNYQIGQLASYLAKKIDHGF